VVYLYPLFVVALCLDFITADRANGTLALTLAQGVSSRSLATARLTIRALALLLAGVVLPAIGIVVAHAVAGQPADVGRLLLWLMAVTGYLAVWVSACLILNARSRSAIANGLTMVTVWAVLTAILPAAVGLVARSVATVPSRILLANSERIERFAANEKMNQAFKDLIASFDAKYPRGPNPEIVRNRFRFVGLLSRPEGNPVLQAFYSTHPEFGRELIHYQIWYAALTGRDIYVERRMTPLFEELRSERRRQQSVAGLLSYLSPSMILKVTLDDIAGTGPERHQRFLTQFGDYLRSREAWFTKRVAAARDISSKDLSNFALFRFDEEPASVVAARVSLPVAALWILAAALLYVGLRRCESATI
jgi:ABC-2 type transport system permease protein